MLLPSAILYLLLLLFSALPLLVLSFTFGGVDVSDFLRTTGATILVLAAVCALGLWCSSLFRRSVHSTATAYGFVLVLCVVTAIIFGVLSSRLGPAASDPPAYV